MKRINIFEYDSKNREKILQAIEKDHSEIVGWSLFKQEQTSFSADTTAVYIDISSLFCNSNDSDVFVAPIELGINILQNEQPIPMNMIVDQKYSRLIKDFLYYKINKVLCLEVKLGIKKDSSENIVEIGRNKFDEIMEYINLNLFGNSRFKQRLKEELEKYRLFNRVGQQPIFSVLICGESGIGKTEVARLLHQQLAPSEPLIKINFGNYSTHDALNSLIGSPRGYVGSNKGELSDKLMHSRSKVIIIDEFEKATEPVYNFFLQLLEEGKFTDSLGREYNLDKYIIIFTSNIGKGEIGEQFPPELRSRFNYKCTLWPLSTTEKEEYLKYKSEKYLDAVKKAYVSIDKNLKAMDIIKIDVTKYSNLRDINNEIMRQIADNLYSIVVLPN